MNLPLFIARRIYKDSDTKKKVSRPAIAIATAGVAIGIAVMVVSVCIVLGFKHSIRDKVIGFGGHITVANAITLYGNQQRPICMNDSILNKLKSFDEVKNVQRYAFKQGILKTESDFLGVVFKGIASEYDTTFIHKSMLSGNIPAFSDKKGSNKIVVSKYMADALHLKTGDKVFAYFIDKDNVRTRRFTVSGVYQTNLTQYDKTICYTDLYTAVRLNNWEQNRAGGAEVLLKDFDKVDLLYDSYINKINRTTDKYGETYSSATIKDTNPQIFSWLDLLDLNVLIILILMICVAGFTMISGLLIIILERTNMIGVLKAIGASNKLVRRTFIWFSVFIIGRGMLIGNAIGLGLILLQYFTGIIKLDASTYYVDVVPVELNIPIIIGLNIATLLLCVMALVAPSYLVSHIHPAKSMKYE